MGIDSAFFDRLAEIEADHNIFRGASVAILGDCRFHTPWAIGNNRADLAQFKNRLGIHHVETLDVAGQPTIQIDLHPPVPDTLAGQFDVVLDAGTAHCCFDVAAVLANCLALMKERGTIIHLSALTGYFGRCYYSFNPLLLKDFYGQNGFEPVTCEYRIIRGEGLFARVQRLIYRLSGHKAGKFGCIPLDNIHLSKASVVEMVFAPSNSHADMIPNDAVMMFVAQRNERRPFVRPAPSFFAQNASNFLQTETGEKPTAIRGHDVR